MPTHKETLASIRSDGMAVECDQGEYRITYRATDMHDYDDRERAAYYTTDRQDAIDTAFKMSRFGKL